MGMELFIVMCVSCRTKGASQYKLKRFVTMATYWVPDLPNIKGIFWLPSAFYVNICKSICMHDPAGI